MKVLVAVDGSKIAEDAFNCKLFTSSIFFVSSVMFCFIFCVSTVFTPTGSCLPL